MTWNYLRSIPFGHYFAASLLALFALSHFTALTVDQPSQASINTVFPFVTNWTMFLVAGVFELVIAIMCFKKRGTEAANLSILVFVAVMLWYRWSLVYTGGTGSCNCLGILGTMLHLTKTQEQVIPVVALSVLSVTILPWVLRRILHLIFACTEATKSTTAIVLLFVAIGQELRGQETIEVVGQYETFHLNPSTGEEYTNASRQVAFKFMSSGLSWSLFATNIAATGEGLKTPWEAVTFDGTNTYTLTPNHRTPRGVRYSLRATITPGPVFIRDYDEYLDFDVIWMTYGLNPSLLKTNSSGMIDLPLPWYNARNNSFGFGAEWKIRPEPALRFPAECLVIANTNLDLSLTQELLRPHLNYPESLGARNRFAELIALRRQQLPQGFVECDYQCTEWFETNQIAIPKVSEQKRYANIWATNFPNFRAQVRAVKLTVHSGSQTISPPVPAETMLVTDYRFRRIDDQRISPFIEYVLAPGEAWKPGDDPKLLKMADESQGRNLNFEGTRRRSYSTWLLLVLILVPVIAVFKGKKETKTEKDTEK